MTNTNNTITFTSNFSKNMLPIVAIGEFGWRFCFVDVKKNTVLFDQSVTKAWLDRKGISIKDFLDTCWGLYYEYKNSGLIRAIASFFDDDDETVYHWHHGIGKNAEERILG